MDRMNGVQIPKAVLFAAGTLLSVFALATLYQKKKKNQIPKKWKTVGKVTGLFLYPLKSGKRVEAKSLEFTNYGAKQTKEEEKVYQMRDRELLVYDPKTLQFKTGREIPKLLFIEVSVHDENYLALDAPGMRTLFVRKPTKDSANNVQIIGFAGEKLIGWDCGEEAAIWISKYTLNDAPGLRLLSHDGIFQRDLETPYKPFLPYYKNLRNDTAGMYSDLTAVHIVNEASVSDLNSRIKNQSTEITPHNFRPNILIESTPYAEDEWEWLKIGEAIFRLAKPCTRCVMTTIDQNTGLKNENGEPLKTLRSYHFLEDPVLKKLEKHAPIMGIDVSVKKTGVVNVGDEIFVGGEKSSIKVALK